jgi:hypothetical protein
LAWRQLCGREIGAWLAGWLVVLLRVAVVATLVAGSGTQGQTAPPQSVEDALHRMSDRAAVVFVGQVTAVRRVDGGGTGSGVVEVSFRVYQAVRGCAAGGTYVLREWAGLWAANDARFRVGQRRLMMLHAPGPGGMSSPVGGMDGAIPVHGVGKAVWSANDSAATIATPAAEMVDLRWIGARLARPVAYRNGQAAVGGSRLAKAANVTAGDATATAGLDSLSGSATVNAASTPAQTAAVGTVVGMLREWVPVAASASGDSKRDGVGSDAR